MVSRLSNITVEVCEQVAQTVYSLHKTATRKVFSPHLVLVLLRNVSCEWKISMAAIAFMWQQVKQAALGAGAQSTEVLCEVCLEHVVYGLKGRYTSLCNDSNLYPAHSHSPGPC